MELAGAGSELKNRSAHLNVAREISFLSAEPSSCLLRLPSGYHYLCLAKCSLFAGRFHQNDAEQQQQQSLLFGLGSVWDFSLVCV